MFCKHNYRYTQGHFYCTKCGHRTYKERFKRKSNRKIIIPIVVVLVGIVAFLYSDELIGFSHNVSEKAVSDIPKIAEDIREKTPEIDKTLDTIKEKVDSTSESVKKSIPKEISQYKPKPELSLDELRQVALDDINKYRKQNGLSALSLGSAVSPQLYSKELLMEGCIHHISDRGEGPMLRYKNNGDQMFLVAENIAGGLGTGWTSPEESILDGNNRMMFDDTESNWGHRDNILNPSHRSVSIGISYDSERLVMIQDFESVLPPGYQYDPSSFRTEPVDARNCW